MPDQTDRRPRVVIAGGGTLGHVFPGLAVAEEISRLAPEAIVTFAGHCAEVEAPHVTAAGFAHRAFRGRALPRGWRGLFSFVRENLAGYLDARRWLRDVRPHVVLATGGYACAPVARACLAAGLPLVLLELNALPGRTSRWLARRATAVCVASPAAAACLKNPNWWLTGTPLRAAFFHHAPNADAPVSTPRAEPSPDFLAAPRSKPERPYTLIVLGGSRGAEELNRCMPQALALAAPYLPGVLQCGHATAPWLLPERTDATATRLDSERMHAAETSVDSERMHGAETCLASERMHARVTSLGVPGQHQMWQVIHLAGPGRAKATAEQYAKFGIVAQVLEFVSAPAALLSCADLAVCRCGASTLAELAACGVPAVLVPYRGARDDHQMANALEVSQAGGGLLVESPQPQAIAAAVAQLADETRRRTMALAMRRLAAPDAARRIATLLLRIAARQGANLDRPSKSPRMLTQRPEPLPQPAAARPPQ